MCPDDPAEPPGGPYSHAADIQPIWDAACVDGCHEAGGFVDDPIYDDDVDLLMDGDALPDMLGVASRQVPELMLVVAGDPDGSYLIQKLEGTQPPGEGKQMPWVNPLLGPPYEDCHLPSGTQQMIRDWVAEGANP